MLHPLAGCWAKVKRAKECIKNLNVEITAFLGSEPKPYRVVGKQDEQTGEYAFIASCPSLPPRFAVLIGEIIHHLRSSLDHLLCALVTQNGASITKKSRTTS